MPEEGVVLLLIQGILVVKSVVRKHVLGHDELLVKDLLEVVGCVQLLGKEPGQTNMNEDGAVVSLSQVCTLLLPCARRSHHSNGRVGERRPRDEDTKARASGRARSGMAGRRAMR